MPQTIWARTAKVRQSVLAGLSSVGMTICFVPSEAFSQRSSPEANV